MRVRAAGWCGVGALAAVLAGCGGGGDGTGTDSAAATDSTASLTQAAAVRRTRTTTPTTTSTTTATTTVTVSDRQAAAAKAATTDPACTGITAFYWEIGDKTGKLGSGQGGTGTTKPTATTLMPVASASKWVYASAVIEAQKGVLSADDVSFLSMRSGYTNFNDCSSTTGMTVAACLTAAGRFSGTNGDYEADTAGQFYYGGGHMQVHAVQRGWGSYTTSSLTTALKGIKGMPTNSFNYTNVQLAGGLGTNASNYGLFLRHVLDGTLAQTAAALGQHAVCAHANGSDCTGVIFSPINQSHPGGPNDIGNESWHYSLGHWVEDDPSLGDGTFSSPGKFGFYPWIDKSKTWYGVLARYDAANVYNTDPTQTPYNTSRLCGRKIRQAWLNP